MSGYQTPFGGGREGGPLSIMQQVGFPIVKYIVTWTLIVYPDLYANYSNFCITLANCLKYNTVIVVQ